MQVHDCKYNWKTFLEFYLEQPGNSAIYRAWHQAVRTSSAYLEQPSKTTRRAASEYGPYQAKLEAGMEHFHGFLRDRLGRL